MIAGWSVDTVLPERTAAYYREARAMIEAKTPVRKDAVGQLSVFERVLPYYKQHKDEVRFGAMTIGGKRVYAWFARNGGRFLGTIDPADPGRRREPEPR